MNFSVYYFFKFLIEIYINMCQMRLILSCDGLRVQIIQTVHEVLFDIWQYLKLAKVSMSWKIERYDFLLEEKAHISCLQWDLLWNLTILTCIYIPKPHSESWSLIDRDSNFGTLLAFTKILKITEFMSFVFI